MKEIVSLQNQRVSPHPNYLWWRASPATMITPGLRTQTQSLTRQKAWKWEIWISVIQLKSQNVICKPRRSSVRARVQSMTMELFASTIWRTKKELSSSALPRSLARCALMHNGSIKHSQVQTRRNRAGLKVSRSPSMPKKMRCNGVLFLVSI